MKTPRKNNHSTFHREDGAALLTVLLVSTLLLAAGGALLLTTNMAATTAVDSTAEAQAYYAAEAGVNMSVNVLRGNVESSPSGTKATFRNAASNSNMNKWLSYTTVGSRSVVVVSTNPPLGYQVSVTDPDNTPVANQPRRLRLDVTGYGPKGSKKQMELLVDRHIFDYSPLATVLIRGNEDNTTELPMFVIGDSNAKTYSGYDNANPGSSIPTFGTTHANDLAKVTNEINSAQPNTVSGVEKVKQFGNSDLPAFLQTADNARLFLNAMQATASTHGRYFTSAPASFGSSASPQLTFVDGNVDLPDGGAGLLIVTGKLTMSGNPSFNGLILALGQGSLERDGSGNGDIFGNIIIAKFARTWPAEENGQPHPFLSPSYETNGGGNSTVAHDSNQLDRALSAVGLRTLAIREH